MFGRKKEPSKGKGNELAQQLGLFGMPADDADDADLDAELLALIGEDGASNARKTSPTKGGKASSDATDPKKLLEMDRQIAAALKEYNSDEELSDTEDPDLLAELEDLGGGHDTAEASVPTGPVLPIRAAPEPASDGVSAAEIQERLELYTRAQAKSKESGDSSKARRMDRGIKTLRDLLKKAQLGRTVKEDDIPPPVAVTSAPKPAPTPAAEPVSTPCLKPAPPTPSPKPVVAPRPPARQKSINEPYEAPTGLSSDEIETHKALCVRRNQFKIAALKAKQNNDKATATKYLKYFVSFKSVIEAFEAKQPIDLSKMPPPPPGFTAPQVKMPVREVERAQGSSATAAEDPPPEEPDDEMKKLYKAPSSAGTAMEALEQRRNKYQSAADEAKEQGNGSKQRRMGRIVKQYDDAIKAYKMGKPVEFDELPCPPGFPPIPTGGSGGPKPPPLGATRPSVAAAEQPAPHASNHRAAPPPPKVKRQMSTLSRNEQNTLFLQERQLQFKKAALKAKQNGEIQLAKRYLTQAHGFDKMIENSKAGLPVDMSNIPTPPGVNPDKLEFVEDSEMTGDRDEMYKKLEQDLINQIRTCTTNADHFTKLGDVSSASKFDKSRLSTQRDLDALKNAYTHGDPVPRFHYENREFSKVQTNSDLGDNDLEITVVRGINYNPPKDYKPSDLDTYVKYEMPFPKEKHQTGDSHWCKSTENPEYQFTSKVSIDRKSRTFHRILNSKSLKLEIYYKRGFLKSYKMLGSVSVKLQLLENQCVVHESYDLMDGRKAVGGKLEVKLRVRNPFQGKQVEHVKEKWLVIDAFERNPNTQAARPKQPKLAANQSFTSLEVLKYEKQLLDQQIQRYQDKLKASELDAIRQKGRALEKQVEDTKAQISKGGLTGYQNYANSIEQTASQYQNEAKAALTSGNRDKAQVCLTKKKLVEKEVESIRLKLARG